MVFEGADVPGTNFDSIRRRVRLVLLLDASREAGLDPLPTHRLHLIAYLSNVLSPVWEIQGGERIPLGQDGAVLKRQPGPFYPDLQADIDRLVGMGIAEIQDIQYAEIDKNRFRFDGRYRINAIAARPLLSYLHSLPSEAASAKYLRELVLALSALSDEEIDRASTQDATYADPHVGVDSVIDFGEWASKNYSSAAAMRVGELVQARVGAGASEKVHLYIRHLRRRLQGAR